MRSFGLTLLIGWVGVAGPYTSVSAQDGTPGQDTSSPPKIAVKVTEPVNIVFIEHVGAYWSVGPHLARARDHMLEHNQPGPLFVRYLANPTSVPPNSLRAQIGLIAAVEHHPKPPYRTARRDSEMIAYMSVDTRTARPMRHLSVLQQWVIDHNYEAVGPVTEVYFVDPEGHDSKPCVELQMTIQPAKSRPIRLSDTIPGESERAKPADSRVSSGTAGLTDEPDLWRQRLEEWTRHRATKSVSESDTTARRRVDARSPSVDRVRTEEIQPSPPKSEVGQPTDTALTVAVLTDLPTGQPSSPALPIELLLKERRFDEIARRMLPPADAIPPCMQVWLGQVVFRVSAVAKGVRQVYPGEQEDVATLAEALRRRYAEVSAGLTIDPLEPATVYLDSESDPLATDKRAIVHQLDLLLGRIALRGVDVTDTLNILTKVLRRTCDLVQQVRD